MNRPRLLILLPVIIIFFCGNVICNAATQGDYIEGSGILATSERNVSDFTGVTFNGVYDVTIHCGKKQLVHVTGDDNIIPFITTHVIHGILHIDLTRSINAKNKINFEINVDRIESIQISGSTNIKLHDVNSKKLEFVIDGTGDALMDGRTDVFDVDISGASDIYAKRLITEKVDVRVSGTGNVELSVTEELNVSIDGIGDVVYYGNPRIVTKEITGIGNVTKR